MLSKIQDISKNTPEIQLCFKEFTLKYMGAVSPADIGNGTHSITMCGKRLRFIAVSKKIASASRASNIRVRALRNIYRMIYDYRKLYIARL